VKKLLLFLLLVISISNCSKDNDPASCPTCTNPILDSSASIIVKRVIDGDTFRFSVGTDSVDVRVVGIDAYETKHGQHLDDQAASQGIDTATAIQIGFKARSFADSLLTNRTITIYRDPSQPFEDAFGRLLRHVFFTDGQSQMDFGKLMLDRHFAIPD
jgi:endonuclease YncB( thermonuclease family)